MASSVFAPTTLSANGSFVLTVDDIPANIIATSLAAGESVSLKTSIDKGANYVASYQGGSEVTLTSTDNVKTVNAPGYFQAIKSTTAGSVGVYLAKGRKPETL